jgi:hypothetical protein
MKSYSQCGQDIFVYNIMQKKAGTYLDIGCSHPFLINNTYLLEKNGWSGISIDIKDYSELWKLRDSKFIIADALNIDYKSLLDNEFKSQDKIIDYLSLDLEIIGQRFNALEKVLNSGYKFKIITIEHDSYNGDSYVNFEKIPQRELLIKNNYLLLCGDISHKYSPNEYYEDWWINIEFFNEKDYKKWINNNICVTDIFKSLNIDYEIDEKMVVVDLDNPDETWRNNI